MSTVIPMYGWDTVNWKESSGKCLSSKNASTKPQEIKRGADDKRQVAEEPDEGKLCAVSRTERIANRVGRSSEQ
jgi:hypothetical protein